MTAPTEPRPDAEAAEPEVPLDDVMLAMDVVDTLRHQRALVDASLDEDRRERGLIERIRAIYASQGIEVPDEVIAEGVEALAQDRFTYDPPERTLAVRLAEVYVDRRKWTKRAAIGAALVLGLWLAVTVPLRVHARAQVAAFAERLDTVARQLDDLARDAQGLGGELAAVREGGVAAAAGEILDGAERDLARLGDRLAAVRTALSPGPEPERYRDEPQALDREIEGHRESLAAIAAGLGDVRGRLQTVSGLAGIGSSLRRLVARLAGVDVEADAAAELRSLEAGVQGALAAGDDEGARRELARLTDLVEVLDQSYELRIVSGRGEQSGIWRHLEGRREGRSYYIIVEAVGPDGAVVPRPVTSEEDQRTSTVRRFGVRVPEAVYERVKADKLDNGIVDDRVFGEKRRGARDATYRFEVAGGAITNWQ